jgi:hypothetical protein
MEVLPGRECLQNRRTTEKRGYFGFSRMCGSMDCKIHKSSTTPRFGVVVKNGQNRPVKKLLAFCHIEKAAGTSLTHILRRIFFLRYATVRPMHKRDTLFFTSRDLNTAQLLNPFLLGIGGHSIVPHGDLLAASQRLAFITQIREPVARAASQYGFWVNRMNLEGSWQAFLEHPVSQNFQVKKIAGCEDLDLAKENIEKHFLLAGTVDQFDEFLVLLARQIGMPLHLFTYRIRNVGTKPKQATLPALFYDRLRERNRLDQQLYEWVRTDLYSKYIAEYPGDFSADLHDFRNLQRDAVQPKTGILLDSIYRNGYLKPVSGLIRLCNGLPYNGSYSTE